MNRSESMSSRLSNSEEGRTPMRVLSRTQAVGELRRSLLAPADDEHSVCQVACSRGIFCRGFARLSDEELKDRYSWLVKARAPQTREELEDLANRWQIAQQFVHGEELSCDVQTQEEDTCRGWNEFSDADLERFFLELQQETVAVISRAPEIRHGRTSHRPKRVPVHDRPNRVPVHDRPKRVRVAAVEARRRGASSHPRPVRPEPSKVAVPVPAARRQTETA